MNKLSLFKSGDLYNIIREALLKYDGTLDTENKDLYESYEIECDDVYENNKHYLDVIVYETSTHYPWQPGDVEGNINNQFRITIECKDSRWQ